MHKITIKLYKEQFASLIKFIDDPGKTSRWQMLNGKSLEEITLIEWKGRITQQQLFTWHLRDRSKQYAVSLPISMAIALWIRCRQVALTIDMQMLFDTLDSTLVDYGFSPNYLPI